MTASADPNAPLAYTAAAAPVQAVEVPLPPRRPDSLAGAADAVPAAAAPEPAAAQQASRAAALPASETVEVPLPPRRPSVLLAAIKRPAPAGKADFPEAVYLAAAVAPAR